jgi:hypothetical protein
MKEMEKAGNFERGQWKTRNVLDAQRKGLWRTYLLPLS